jgi:hypothetical protein
MTAAMQRRRALLVAAVLAFVGGWVLPVVDDYRGWQAFRVALSPAWPYENFRFDAWYDAALTIASSLTNVVFVLALAAVTLRLSATRTLTGILLGAVLLNLQWLVRAGAQFTELGVGYFVWVAAFPLLALAARES